MPVFNAEKYIKYSIESILNQTFKDFEFIIINDGSRDNSSNIIESYSAKDERIKLVSQNNSGASNAFNKGLSIARGEYIARMDADDISTLNRFELQYNFLKKNKEISAIGGAVKIIDENNNIIKNIFYPSNLNIIKKQIQFNIPIAFPSMIIRKEILDKFNGLRTFLDPADDYDLWLRLLDSNIKISNIRNFVLHYRVHSNSLSHRKKNDQNNLTIISYLSSMSRNKENIDFLSGINNKDELSLKKIPDKYQLSKIQKFVYKNLNLQNLNLKDKNIIIKKFFQILSHSEFQDKKPLASRFLFTLSISYLRGNNLLLFFYYFIISFIYHPMTFIDLIRYRIHCKIF